MFLLDDFIRSSFLDAKKHHVQLVSFDIKKAFDSIWPEAVLKQLVSLGIGGKFLEYIRGFLSERKFSVIVGGVTSTAVVVDGT